VTRRSGATLTEREVVRHCLASLEAYMVPKFVAFVDELPRTDSGKIRKLDLH
jgi:acyl-coenzyme A synthetase/AMP-(fatty) acid ligase